MGKLILVKAVEGRTVFVPGSHTVVPEEGIEVEDSSYWLRRIDDGDVELVTKPKRTAAEADKDKK